MFACHSWTNKCHFMTNRIEPLKKGQIFTPILIDFVGDDLLATFDLTGKIGHEFYPSYREPNIFCTMEIGTEAVYTGVKKYCNIVIVILINKSEN